MVDMPTSAFQGPDYSNQPLLPAWYIYGWSAQNDAYLEAPANAFAQQQLPVDQVFVSLTGMYFDPGGNPLGGYLTFEPSDNITIVENGTYFRIPSRLTGQVPSSNWWGFNYQGSGKIYLFQGGLQVILMATDNPNTSTDSGDPLVYHVKEYFLDGMNYDITVPMGDQNSSVDIHSLIVSGTMKPNQEWNQGY